MKVPGWNFATIEGGKVSGYLLSETHPNGKHKARFFFRFGFRAEQPELLIEALQKHIANDYIKAERTAFGLRYIVEAALEAPDGRNPRMRSVWFVEHGGRIPRLITAYPVMEDVR